MKYLEDIDNKAQGMPFGELTVTILRHRSKTAKVTYVKESKIAPDGNKNAFFDLQNLLNALISGGFSGKLQFDVDMKDGTISLITIKNTEIKTYGSSIT